MTRLQQKKNGGQITFALPKAIADSIGARGGDDVFLDVITIPGKIVLSCPAWRAGR